MTDPARESPEPRGVAGTATAKALATLLAGGVAVEFAAATLAKSSVLALAVEAVVADFTASRLGVPWSTGTEPNATRPKLAAIGRGATFGLGLASFVTLVSLVSQHAELTPNRPALTTLAFALISAILPALRDEALLRGSVLRVAQLAARDERGDTAFHLSAWTSIQMLFVCALVAAAYAAGQGAPPLRIVYATALATIFTALWLVDGTGWRPVAAHAAWSFMEAGLVGGGILNVHAGAAFVDAFHGPVPTGALVLAAFAVAFAIVQRNRHILLKVG